MEIPILVRRHLYIEVPPFVRGIDLWPVGSPHKGPVTRENLTIEALVPSHYGDVIMGAIASQIISLTVVTRPFIQTQIKENIKAPRHWPLCGEFTGDRWIPRTNGQWRGKCFHLMTSSCPSRGFFFSADSSAIDCLHQTPWLEAPQRQST